MTTDQEAQEPARQPAAGPFWFAVGLTSAWILLLGLVTWRYSNPVTLNIEQILSSDRVLIGRVVPAANGTKEASVQFVIEPVDDVPESKEDWPLDDQSPVVLSNLAKTAAKPANAYLFPVIKDQTRKDTFQVQSADLVDGSFLIYPLTEESIQQLHTIRALRPPVIVFPPPNLPATLD